MHGMPRTCFPSRTRQPVRIPAIERHFSLTRSDTMARRSFQSGFPDAARPDDRVLAIGLRSGEKNSLLVLEEATDAAEKKLLQDFTK